GESVPVVGDVGVAVFLGDAVLVQADEHDRVNGQQGAARDHVSGLGAHGQGGPAEFGGAQADLDQIALDGGGAEVDLRDVLGDHALVAQLEHGVDGSLLVNPFQEAAAE